MTLLNNIDDDGLPVAGGLQQEGLAGVVRPECGVVGEHFAGGSLCLVEVEVVYQTSLCVCRLIHELHETSGCQVLGEVVVRVFQEIKSCIVN